MTTPFRQKYGDFVVQRRWPIIIFFAVIIAIAGYFSTQFKIDASADTLLTKDNKLFIESQLAARNFPADEFILVAYKPRSGELYSDQTFEDLRLLERAFLEIERVDSVNSVLNVPLFEDRAALFGAGDIADLTFERQGYSPEQMQSFLDGHPIFTDLLVNRQQTAFSLQLVFTPNSELSELNEKILDITSLQLERDLTSEENQQLDDLKEQAEPLQEKMSALRANEIDQIDEIRARVEENAETFLGGAYVVGKHLIDIITSDLITFGTLIAAMIVVLLAVTFRRVAWVVFPLAACTASVLMSVGLFGALGLKTTVISANFIALQLILTLAVMLHLICCFREIARDNPSSKQSERVALMVDEKLSPCFSAAITTSVGFAALIFSGIQPVIDFGIMMLLAMSINTLVSLLLFPAILACLKISNEPNEYRFFTKFLDAIRRLSIARPKLVTAALLVSAIVLGLGIPKLNVENSFINYFDKKTEIYRELSFIDQEFGGSTALDVIINLDEEKQNPDLIISAENFNQLSLAHAVVDAFDATGNVTSLANFTELGKQVNDDRPLTEYELDAVIELADQNVVRQLIGGFINTDANQVKISTRVKDATEGLDRSEFLANLRGDLAVVGLEDTQYQLTNLFVLYQDILSRLFESQILTLGIVYAALGIVFLIIFRDIKIAVVALVPNIMITVMLLGVIGWLGVPLDLMTITIAAIAMGIAVDDTIHFISASLAKKNGNDFKYAFSHTGLAILITSLIIAVGFSMFSLSEFLPSVYFGLLTAFAMTTAMFIDVLFLPIMMRFIRREDQVTKNSKAA